MDNYAKATKGVADFWGQQMPMLVMEEAGELIQAISKVERGKEDAMENLMREMADMYISLEALSYHYGIGPSIIADYIGEKLNKKY